MNRNRVPMHWKYLPFSVPGGPSLLNRLINCKEKLLFEKSTRCHLNDRSSSHTKSIGCKQNCSSLSKKWLAGANYSVLHGHQLSKRHRANKENIKDFGYYPSIKMSTGPRVSITFPFIWNNPWGWLFPSKQEESKNRDSSKSKWTAGEPLFVRLEYVVLYHFSAFSSIVKFSVLAFHLRVIKGFTASWSRTIVLALVKSWTQETSTFMLFRVPNTSFRPLECLRHELQRNDICSSFALHVDKKTSPLKIPGEYALKILWTKE